MITLITVDDMRMGLAWEFQTPNGIDFRIEHSPATNSVALFYRNGRSWVHRFTRNIDAHPNLNHALAAVVKTVTGDAA